MRTSVSKDMSILLLFYLGLVVGCFIFPWYIEVGLFGVFIILSIILSDKIVTSNSNEVNILLIFPVFLSAVQNLYLGLAANHLTLFELQILLTLNVTFAFVLAFKYSIYQILSKKYNWCLLCIVVIVIYSLIELFFIPVPIVAFMASLRNILAPFIFYLFGLVLGEYTSLVKFEKYIIAIVIFVISFGFIEYMTGGNIWKVFNISKLWYLKGIEKDLEGFPDNWYASEVILGHENMKRMVSSFADPVNLGTFLFAAVMICWYFKKYVLMVLALVCCALTISKGALLGLLIFSVIFAFYVDKRKILFSIVSFVGLVIGISLLKYGAGSSIGIHLRMFVNSLMIPLSYPFGLGVGEIGVLANVVTGGGADLYIGETGIGVVIGELGVFGIFIYGFLFYKMLNIPWHFDTRTKIFLYSLILAVFSNALFNEVALSPNSCGVYFMIMGITFSNRNSYMLIGENNWRKGNVI